MTASADLILQLYNGENWGAHPELAYIYKMRELFKVLSLFAFVIR